MTQATATHAQPLAIPQPKAAKKPSLPRTPGQPILYGICFTAIGLLSTMAVIGLRVFGYI